MENKLIYLIILPDLQDLWEDLNVFSFLNIHMCWSTSLTIEFNLKMSEALNRVG